MTFILIFQSNVGIYTVEISTWISVLRYNLKEVGSLHVRVPWKIILQINSYKHDGVAKITIVWC